VPQVVWYVDGEPYAVTDPDQPVFWTVKPGAHTFQLRLPAAGWCVADDPGRGGVRGDRGCGAGGFMARWRNCEGGLPSGMNRKFRLVDLCLH